MGRFCLDEMVWLCIDVGCGCCNGFYGGVFGGECVMSVLWRWNCYFIVGVGIVFFFFVVIVGVGF